MRRREVIAALGAAAWSGGVWAQPAERVHRLGALLPAAQVARSFREATVPELAKLGFVEGRNLVIDARLASFDKMPVVAAELVRSNPDAILAVGGEAIAASIAASDTIPVVMYGADALLRDQDLPLSRSRGNATGFAILGPELDIKRLEILREAVPMAARIGVLVQPSTPNIEGRMRDLAAAARDQRFEPIFIQAAGSGDYPAAFAAFRAARVAALLIASHPQFNTDAGELAAMSLAAGLPTMCHWPEMAASGCLLAYGPSRVALFRRSAEYIARILAGTSPRDLPIERPAQVELCYNLRTSRALGLQLPTTLLARADEVIE
jgi:putative tryptophan/tyrosine transport system substrate-binding protein